MAARLSFLVLYCLVSALSLSLCSRAAVPIVDGLSYSFYDSTCPKVEKIVRKYVKSVLKDDIGQAAGLLRLHFHDCFVQGCDASVLLDGSTSGPSEQSAIPNLTLRARAFQIIDELQALIQKECRSVVSCADIVALAARESVHMAGGPKYSIPLGRKDGLKFATQNATLANLPSPFSNTTTLLKDFAAKGFDATDLVALSGGHTIGIAHCGSFTPRLYPIQDPSMNSAFASNLKLTCPSSNSTNTTVLDIGSDKFDAKYYVSLTEKKGLLTSDQDLFTNSKTKSIVQSFAANKTLFFEKFVDAMIKMGQLSVVTGKDGEIRTNCSAINSAKTLLPIIDGDKFKDELK